jgi:hypothetical protein
MEDEVRRQVEEEVVVLLNSSAEATSGRAAAQREVRQRIRAEIESLLRAEEEQRQRIEAEAQRRRKPKSPSRNSSRRRRQARVSAKGSPPRRRARLRAEEMHVDVKQEARIRAERGQMLAEEEARDAKRMKRGNTLNAKLATREEDNDRHMKKEGCAQKKLNVFAPKGRAGASRKAAHVELDLEQLGLRSRAASAANPIRVKLARESAIDDSDTHDSDGLWAD